MHVSMQKLHVDLSKSIRIEVVEIDMIHDRLLYY